MSENQNANHALELRNGTVVGLRQVGQKLEKSPGKQNEETETNG